MHTPTRRVFLASTIALAARPLFADTPPADPKFAPFDTMMADFVKDNEVPGAALAVGRHGKLVYSRGFGHADAAKKEPTKADALFRIASVSKPLTAVAVMRLVEKGELALDDKVLDRMKLEAPKGTKPDPRWKAITVRDCLRHTGGWDRDASYDPIGRVVRIAKELAIPLPVGPNDVVRYMMGEPLDFDPGEKFAYSNLGYLVLGRIIEQVTGQKYEEHVKKEILAPLGITTAKLGRAKAENRAAGEVAYFDRKNRTGPSVYPPDAGKPVPVQYGAANFEGYGAHGGWIASAEDLVRFAGAFHDPEKCPLLTAKSLATMWERPAGLAGHDKEGKPTPAYYGCGWGVRPVGKAGKLNAWHNGYITGSEALMVRRNDGLCWAVLFNTSDTPAGKGLTGAIDPLVHKAADAVKWG